MLRSHSPSKSTPGARALYLGGCNKKRVTCTEAALVVTNDRAQTWRYPLARVARIISSTVTDWSGPALALCMRRGVGIAWVDGRGELLGASYAASRGGTDFATALELMVETTDGLTKYLHWQRSRRMDMLMRWCTSRAKSMSPQQWERFKREWIYASAHTVHLPQALRGLCLAYVSSQLAGHGLSPVLWGPETQRIDLDGDLASLLWAEMNLFAGTFPEKVEQHAPSTVALFERWNARNASTLVLHLHSLQRTAMKALMT